MNARDITMELRRQITTSFYAQDARLPPERALSEE